MPPPGLPRPAVERWPRCVLDAPHSLLRQSYAPRDMRGGGTVNADGFGVGWYPPGEPGAAARRYRRSVPIWTDASLADAGRRDPLRRGRSRPCAPRPPACRSPKAACAPVRRRALAVQPQRAWSAAGRARWPRWRPACRSTDLLTLDAPTDSALLWALVRHRLRAGSLRGRRRRVRGHRGRGGRAAVPAQPAAHRRRRPSSATTWTHALWTRRTEAAIAVSSEPWDPDDDTWVDGPRPAPGRGHPARASPPDALDDRGWS